MPRLNERQEKILRCLNVFLGKISEESALDDSVIITRIASELAVIVRQPSFQPSQMTETVLGLILKYTMTQEEIEGKKPMLQ